MATMTSSAAVSIPAFTGLRPAAPKAKVSAVAFTPSSSKAGPVKASLKDFGLAAATVAATAALAGNAMAMEVLLGGDDGSLAFVPGTFKVAAGEKIVFKNNAGFPHNVVFDEDAVPSGVDVAKISMPEEEYLNGPGETYAVTLSEKGEYSFYCAPHQGAGMAGKVIVE